MIKLIFLSLVLLSQLSFASSGYEEMVRLIQEVTAFNQKNKTLSATQIDPVTAQLKKVIIIDKLDAQLDRSEEAAMTLFNSYLKNKAVYLKAMETMDPADKKRLQEIFKSIEEFSKNGNG